MSFLESHAMADLNLLRMSYWISREVSCSIDFGLALEMYLEHHLRIKSLSILACR